MSYQRMKMAVGLFVIILILSTLGLSVFVLHKKGVFEQRFSYHFSTDSAQSFTIGMPLLLSGFEIGRIDNISLTTTGKVDIVFSVNQTNHQWMTENTFLTLKKPLIGSPYIEVFSNRETPLLLPGATIQMNVSDDINDIITKLEPTVRQLSTIIADLAILTTELAKPDGALFSTLNNVQSVSEKLKQSPSFLASLTGNPQDGNTLSATLQESQTAILKIQKTIDETNQLVVNMKGSIVQPTHQILVQVDGIMKDITQKLAALDNAIKAVGSSDQDILILKQQLLKSVEKTNAVIDQVDYILQDSDSNRLELP